MSFSFARLGFAGARLAAVGIVFAIAGIGGAEEECPSGTTSAPAWPISGRPRWC